jgi:LacI family transcriptional regulator
MATIKEVARLAGVSLGTASRVISGKGSVAPATAKRVHRAIEQLNFRPSHAARSLLSGSTQMIGVYIPFLKGTFYTPILQAIDAELRAGGRHMVVAFGHGSADERCQAIEREFL